MCHRSVGLIARAIESRGIATIALSHFDSVAGTLGVPRTIVLTDRALGKAFGEPGNQAGQRHDLLRCLSTGLALEHGQSAELSLND